MADGDPSTRAPVFHGGQCACDDCLSYDLDPPPCDFCRGPMTLTLRCASARSIWTRLVWLCLRCDG